MTEEKTDSSDSQNLQGPPSLHSSPSFAAQHAIRRAFIGLGSNVAGALPAVPPEPAPTRTSGELAARTTVLAPAATIEAAAARIGFLENVSVIQLSSIYTSEPAYHSDQPPFSNAVLEVKTRLTAKELLRALLAIEQEFGRVRTLENGPRTLDCDLLDYEGVVLETEELMLPHPGILERDFVVTPFLEIAPAHVLADGTPLTREQVSCGFVQGIQEAPTSQETLFIQETPTTQEGPLFSLCATPIGNLGDVTLRVLKTLKEADLIYAEDTRVTRKLLTRYDIHAHLERGDEHATKRVVSQLLERLEAGERIAYVTDAGMPGISDPGMELVRAVRAAGYTVEVVPGASAVITALVASGFSARAFYFGGFLPRTPTARKTHLLALATPVMSDVALVFYESPHRAIASLEVLEEVFPTRVVCLARELTKMHEETLFGTPSQLLSILRARVDNKRPLKGEVALVIAPEQSFQKAEVATDQEIMQRVEQLQQQSLKRAQVAKILVQEFNMTRSEAYEAASNAQ